MDSLLDKMDCLSVASLTSKVLLYTAWLSNPKDTFLSPTQSKEELAIILKDYLKINLKLTELPTLIPKDSLPLFIKVNPYKSQVPPEPKPNMLLAVASLFNHLKKTQSAALLESLNAFDIVMPRKPLKCLLSFNLTEFQTYAFRPYAGSPLFLDRISSYPTNPGSVGMQFEKLIVIKPPRALHRAYGIFHVKVDKMNILVTGEVDGVDEFGNPIEVKTKPSYVKPTRLLQNWAQSAIGNVSTIVTGEFISTKSRAVVFDTVKSIQYQTLEEYSSSLLDQENAVTNAETLLDAVLTDCKKVGVVYRVSGSASGSVICKELSRGEYEFPISKMIIETLAELT